MKQQPGPAWWDRQRCRATAFAGTTVAAFGDPLWDAGLSLANQGDIDTQ